MLKLNKPLKITFFALYFLTLIFIIINAGLDGESSSEVSGGFIDVLHEIPPYQFLSSRIIGLDQVIRKLVGHYSLYFLLGVFGFLVIVSTLPDGAVSVSVNAASGFVWAGITEIIQIFAANRGPAFTDVIVNFEGYFSAHCLILSVILIVQTVKRRRYDKNTKIFNAVSVSVSAAIIIAFTAFSAKSREINACFGFFCLFALVYLSVLLIRIALNREN